MDTRTGARWTGWTLLLLGMAAYSTAPGGRFQFDDFRLVVDNPQLSTPGALWHSLAVGLRPFTKLTLAANVWLHGLRPAGFHLVNLGLHLFSGVLLFRLLGRVPRLATGSARTAWFAAAIFLLHPAQTEAVTYVSGRSSCLMTACLLLAHWLAWRSERSEGGSARRWSWRAASVGVFVLAVLAKEVGVIYPLLAVVWLRVLEGRTWRAVVDRVWPHVLAAAALLGALLSHPSYRRLIGDAFERLPWTETLFSQVRAVTRLIGIVVFPWRVNIDHALPRASRLGEVWPELLLLGLVVLIALASARRLPLFAGGLLWGLAALVPTNSLLVRQDLIADRLLYLPMVGFALALAVVLTRAASSLDRKGQRLAMIVALAVSLALGAATFHRNLLYWSETALWTDSVEKAPHNARAHHNLGYAYELEGDLDRALAEYRVAVDLAPETARYRRSLEIVQEKLAKRH